MQPMEVGVFLASLGVKDTVEAIKKAKELGIGIVQFHGAVRRIYYDQGRTDEVRKALEGNSVTASAACAGYAGESYRDIQAVKETVGLTNPATLEERIEETKRFADFASELGIPILTTHIGVIPEDRSSEDYRRLLGTIGLVADYCKSKSVTFAMETGQESAAVMVDFMNDLGSDNVKINFDPANMILYDSGDPIEALETLKGYVVHVHCKDGRRPTEAGKLGHETPLGEGEVGIDRYVAKLKEIGYTGPLLIEREGGADRTGDVMRAKALLEKLRDQA
jgi:L-ribulose-5-phosphate 3-epimerase